MRVLLLNAGSSGLKCTLMQSEGNATLGRTSADWAGPSTRYERSTGAGTSAEEVPWRGYGDAVRRSLRDLVGLADEDARSAYRSSSVAAVGHRIVHGGGFRSSVRIASDVRARISALAELAPLHNPPALETLAAAEAVLPDAAHVAVFDTAFHATLPLAARTYAVPDLWSSGWGIRRYGFHGLSHAYCSKRAAVLLGQPVDELRLVICHLGHGCSAAAVLGGRCIDTTMGFTPLDGLMMATRSGSLDPGIVLHVQRHHGLSAKEVEEALHHGSGLLGVSGVSADMREVLAAARSGNARARLAVDVYAHRLRQAIGALTASLGGIDALVFTAGVGENSNEVRALCCRGLECLGLELDADLNARARPDVDVARAGSPARILVIATREDQTMLEEVLKVMAA